MRVNDVVFAFPAVLLAIMLAAAYGASTLTAMLAIGIANVPVFARLTRGETLRVLSSEYVLAARGAGRRRPAVFVRHVLPNIAPVLIVQATVLFALAILAEAALSYLGLGTPAPTPSWGRSLQESQTFFGQRPTLGAVPRPGHRPVGARASTSSATGCATPSTRSCGWCGRETAAARARRRAACAAGPDADRAGRVVHARRRASASA